MIAAAGRSRHVEEQGGVAVVTAPEARHSLASALLGVVAIVEGERGRCRGVEVEVEETSYPQVLRDVQAVQSVLNRLEMGADPGMLAAGVDM